ncbi:MAG TPA: hypothetical protein VGP10_03940, partial [Marisediminicola sp.]|nr:hypothetical protein [Marisediminicola sp.]
NVLWEATPTVGGPVGRLCTVAGTPGTWKTFGIIGEIRAAALADMGALTAPATFSAAYTKTESEALRTDVATLRTLVNTLLANRRTAGEQA